MNKTLLKMLHAVGLTELSDDQVESWTSHMADPREKAAKEMLRRYEKDQRYAHYEQMSYRAIFAGLIVFIVWILALGLYLLGRVHP